MSAAEGLAEGKQSLSQTFNKLNHFRHTIMDFSMIFMAIGAVVAGAGPLVGILDPITPFIKMHFQGWLMAPDALSQFIPDAMSNLDAGTWFSGIDASSSMHNMHGMAAASVPDAMGHAAHSAGMMADTGFDQWVEGMSPEQLSAIKSEANGIYGMSLKDYHSANFMHHAP